MVIVIKMKDKITRLEFDNHNAKVSLLITKSEQDLGEGFDGIKPLAERLYIKEEDVEIIGRKALKDRIHNYKY